MKTTKQHHITEEMATIENMPKMIATLQQMVARLNDRIDSLCSSTEESESKQWLNVSDLQKYLPSHPKRQTIYSWTSTRQIPFHKKGRSVMFDKAEIDAWLQDSEHHKSLCDIERDAQNFVNRKKQ